MNTLNKRGPSTDPCGTPFDTVFQLLNLLLILTLCFSLSEVTVNEFQTV